MKYVTVLLCLALSACIETGQKAAEAQTAPETLFKLWSCAYRSFDLSLADYGTSSVAYAYDNGTDHESCSCQAVVTGDENAGTIELANCAHNSGTLNNCLGGPAVYDQISYTRSSGSLHVESAFDTAVFH